MSFLNAVKVGAARLPPKPAPAPNPSSATAPAPAIIDLTGFPFRPVPLAFIDAVGEAGRGLQDVFDLDEQAILAGCGFLGGALATGGQHHPEPLWHLAVLASTWFKDGRNVAHNMSNKHAGYNVEDTNDKYDRKVKDRADKDLGWPSCATISGYGCKECATCPHLAEGKSPLNLGIVSAPVAAAAVTDTSNQIYPGYYKFALPDHYMFNPEGRVCYVDHIKEKNEEGKWETRVEPVPMLDNQHILMPVVHKGPPQHLQFDVDGSVGELARVSLERSICASPTDTLRRLIDQGVRPNTMMKNKLGDFFMSLIGRLEQEIKSIQSKALGWIEDGGRFAKFSYGSFTFNPDGSTGPGGYLDDEMKLQYNPVGELEPVKAAFKFITDQKRQDFALFLACTVAAPLVQFSDGQNIGIASMWGDSGGGKSHTLKTASAYWGHPEKSRLSQSSTANHLGHKAGILANLPVFWDEISSEIYQKAMLDFAMQDGRERQRLMSHAGILKIRHSGEWSTILASTSNKSLLGYVSRAQRDTAAGRYRIFEWKADKQAPPEGMGKWDIDQYIGNLKFNFGTPGLIYAAYLAKRSAELPELLRARGREFDAKVNAKPQERFWSTFCACVLLGAEFNVELGLIDFDVPALEEYLVKQFLLQRQGLEEDGQEGSSLGREILTAFIKEHFQGILITDGLPAKGGHKGVFKILRQPAAHMAKGIFVQWVNRPVEPIVRISRNRLNEWLEMKKYPASVVYERIKHRITSPVVLGGKTPFAAGPERAVQIDLAPGHWLYEVMHDLHSNTQST